MCHCETSFVPVGCYKDQENHRLLRHYILNERDPSTSNYGGRLIDWSNWHEYLPQFICRCAKKAKLLGYDVFGIEYYGKYIFTVTLTDASDKIVLFSDCKPRPSQGFFYNSFDYFHARKLVYLDANNLMELSSFARIILGNIDLK